jgi:hypothetical protein
MKGLELSRQYFNEIGLPMLRQRFGPYLDRMAAGLVGPGSECWGFDDEISQDHDWGPGFCLWLNQSYLQTIGAELVRAYQELPGEFMGHSARIPLPGEEGRVGPIGTEAFYQRYTGLSQPPRTLQEWARIPVANLALVTNGQVFHDPLGRFTSWREILATEFPEDLRLRQIAARCMGAGQAGQYNLLRSLRRRDNFAAGHALSLYCKELMEMVFWLNRRYPPYYKWLHRGVKELPILGRIVHDKIGQLMDSTDVNDKINLSESLAGDVIGQLRDQGLSGSPSDFLMDHGPEVQGRIKDPAIRADFKAGA